MGLQTRPAMAQGLDSRPTVEDFREDSAWVKLAKTHWLSTSNVRKAKQDVIKKEIWDPLEAEGFNVRSLLTLENLSILEKYDPPLLYIENKKTELTLLYRYLWPTYTEDASNYHVLLIALIVSVKQREHLSIWGMYNVMNSNNEVLTRELTGYRDLLRQTRRILRSIPPNPLDEHR